MKAALLNTAFTIITMKSEYKSYFDPFKLLIQ